MFPGRATSTSSETIRPSFLPKTRILSLALAHLSVPHKKQKVMLFIESLLRKKEQTLNPFTGGDRKVSPIPYYENLLTLLPNFFDCDWLLSALFNPRVFLLYFYSVVALHSIFIGGFALLTISV